MFITLRQQSLRRKIQKTFETLFRQKLYLLVNLNCVKHHILKSKLQFYRIEVRWIFGSHFLRNSRFGTSIILYLTVKWLFLCMLIEILINLHINGYMEIFNEMFLI